ncbi:hypothetical protein, partial [Clostridium tertium]|uniref:hypothetical protein n=1 Tax=Clostridium tertium TaxID=1559 RepID=UPI002FEF0D48
SIEIQKVFLDWWKPEIGDLATGRYANIVAISSQRDIDAVKIYKGEPYAIPLFTEGQLRKFIEDKTNGLLDVECNDLNDDYYFYTIRIFEIKELEYGKEFGEILIEEYIECEDLLQAYWKVACMVAKEGLNEI